METAILLPERNVRTQKKVEPEVKHDSFSSWLDSIEQKMKAEFIKQ